MKKANAARKRACKCPRDENGKFLPKGSRNRFKKKIKHHPNKKRRKKNVFNPSPLEDIAQILNPIKDISELLGPVLTALGGSDITKKTLADAISTHAGNTKLIKTPRRMAKRRRNNNGPGRKKDIFPNFMTGKVAQSTEGEFVTTLVNTPIPRLQTVGNKATVMELLWIEAFTTDLLFDSDKQIATWTFTIGQKPTQILDYSDPRVFAAYFERFNIIEFGTPVHQITSHVMKFPKVYNFQDGAGHGYLLAADSFHVSIWSSGPPTLDPPVFSLHWRLYYRFIDVPLNEFIGIVQSTQT